MQDLKHTEAEIKVLKKAQDLIEREKDHIKITGSNACWFEDGLIQANVIIERMINAK